MKNNAEIRALAWKRLWADHWFGRLFGGGMLLSLVGYAVQGVLGGLLGRLGVTSWLDYLQLMAERRTDAAVTLPALSPDFISRATSSTVLTLFISFIMSGIAAYGAAVILKRCLRNDEKGWLGAAFGGFAAPFGMLGLFLLLWFVWLGYTVLAVGLPALVVGCLFPFLSRLDPTGMTLAAGFGAAIGLCWALWIVSVPFYRYRFLWLVKADHPDWGALKCLRSCRELMAGNMMTSFRLDCAFWKPLALVLVPIAGVLVFSLLGYVLESVPLIVLGTVLCTLVALPIGWVVALYVHVGQGFLYEELLAARVTAA